MMQNNAALFEPDVLLPSQFYTPPHQQMLQKRGEYRLLIAVLRDAIECFQKYADAKERRRRVLFREAQRWIMTRGGGDDSSPMSFEQVCGVLGLDPAYLRENLQRRRIENR